MIRQTPMGELQGLRMPSLWKGCEFGLSKPETVVLDYTIAHGHGILLYGEKKKNSGYSEFDISCSENVYLKAVLGRNSTNTRILPLLSQFIIIFG